MPADSDWFSDRALRKQAEIDALSDGQSPTLEMLTGMLEPRVPALPHEKCVNCGSDAREQVGGDERRGVRWCSLCLDRGRDEDYEPTELA